MKLHCDMLIFAGTILTQNKERQIIKNSAIAIKNGYIADMDSREKIIEKWFPDTVLDYGNDLLMPGLINSHTHAAMTFLRGLGDDQPLMKWLTENIFPLEAKLTPEITFLGSMLGYAEMLATGTTSCIDMYIFEESVFEAAQKTGIRCLGGEAVFEFPSAAFQDYQSALKKTADLAEKFKNNDRIKIAVNPHSVYTTTPEILSECLELALNKSLPIHIHLGETKSESSVCKDRHGSRPVEWCRKNGLFQAKLIAAHLVDLNDDEIEFLATTNCIAVHNPVSNMKLASGMAPVCKMLQSDIPVALGTDGPASNNSLSMFSEMKMAALLQKISTGDPTALPACQALDMATLAGAQAFGDPALGSIEIGKKADCVIVDTKAPNLFPLHNPVSQIVYAATGHECKMTMVGGEILFQEGKFTKFDYNDLQNELDKLHNFIIENY